MSKQQVLKAREKVLQDMIEMHSRGIYHLAVRYTGDRHRAEDITQETFLRAFAALDNYDPERPAKPWLFKIALNICRNLHRDTREQPAEIPAYREDRVLLSGGEASGSPDYHSPEGRMLENERNRELADALNSLPAMYREPLILKHVNELSYREMCDILGWELSIVKNRLYRGRMMLRQEYLKRSNGCGEGKK